VTSLFASGAIARPLMIDDQPVLHIGRTVEPINNKAVGLGDLIKRFLFRLAHPLIRRKLVLLRVRLSRLRISSTAQDAMVIAERYRAIVKQCEAS
jgi:hypothetical protein